MADTHFEPTLRKKMPLSLAHLTPALFLQCFGGGQHMRAFSAGGILLKSPCRSTFGFRRLMSVDRGDFLFIQPQINGQLSAMAHHVV